MKKFIFASALICFMFSTVVFAQQKSVLFGFRAAPNLGWMKSNTKGYESAGTEIGYSWGFIADFHLMENYDIVTGVDVVNLNSTLEFKEAYVLPEFGLVNGELIRKYVLEYLEIPMALKMKTNEFGDKTFFGKVGLSTAFLISARVKDKFQNEETGLITNEMDYYEKVVFARYSVLLGIGVQYNVGGSTSILTGIDFSNGISDVLKDTNNFDQSLQQQAINNHINFYVGILF